MKSLARNLALVAIFGLALAGCAPQEPAPTGPPKGGEALPDSGSIKPAGGGATQETKPLTIPGKGKPK